MGTIFLIMETKVSTWVPLPILGIYCNVIGIITPEVTLLDDLSSSRRGRYLAALSMHARRIPLKPMGSSNPAAA